MGTPLIQILLLGVLQGLTEFLPVSSSGHLALAQTLYGIDEAQLTLSIVLHGGTLLATVLFFRQRLLLMLRDAIAALSSSRVSGSTPPRDGAHDLLLVLVASVPTAVIGLLLRDWVEHWTSSPLAVGAGFLITTLVLTSTRFVAPGISRSPSWLGALLIGVVQGISVAPGISRSGSTIAAALWLGVRSERAFELSMLISLPAVTGAFLLELRRGFGGQEHALSLVLGAATAFVVGVLALMLLRHAVTRGRLVWFVLWVGPLTLATLAMAWAWPPTS